MRIEMLGRFQVQVGNTWVDDKAWRLQKARSLVKILALQPDHRMHREEIIELLWSGEGYSSRSNNFHRTLHAARRALDSAGGNGEDRFLRLARGVLDLYPGGAVATDVEEFENEARSARQSSSIEAFENAIQLWGGELLPEDLYEDWAADRRRALRSSVQNLLLRLAQLYEDCGEHSHAIEHLTRLVELEPSDEEAHVALIRRYALAGHRQQALRQFHHLREVLRRELEDEPTAESQHLYHEILSGRFPAAAPERQEPSGGVASAKSTRHASGHPNNLPVALTSFVGRERELEEVIGLVSKHRLVTFTGSGGIGKTRLALEIGASTLKSYPDGVWLVQLAATTDSMLIEQLIAESIGATEQPCESLLEIITDFLRPRATLLVLDNCEHVVQHAAQVVDHLLRYCPAIRVLATSREALRVPGEMVWHVPSLLAPAVSDTCPGSVLETEAVRLFIERAQMIQTGFSVAEGDAPHLARICQQLDGMPLAIELAAARTPILSPAQLADRLDDALPILTDSPRTVPSRQKTMEAAIEWSYERLSSSEQWLFRQLSVFVGGISVEAMETVVEDSEVPVEVSWIDLLKQLIAKSFVSVVEAPGERRYRIPEPLRQYGIRLLERHSEVDGAKNRHGAWCLRLAEHASHALDRSITPEAMEPLDLELGNLRAALSWTLTEDPGASRGLRLAAALWRYWEIRGLLTEGRTWLERALSRGSQAPLVLRARALYAAGNLARNHGDFENAIKHHEESLRLRRQLDDRHGEAAALNNLGAVYRDLGQYDRTTKLCSESLQLFREDGDDRGAAIALINLGMAARQQGDLGSADRYYRESLVIFRRRADERHIAAVLNYLAQIAVQQQEYSLARTYVDESLHLNREVGDTWGEALALMTFGATVEAGREHAKAASVYIESIEVLHRLGVKHHVAQCLARLASVSHRIGDSSTAIRLLGAAQAIREIAGVEVQPSEMPNYEQLLASLRETTGEQEFATLWASGWAMTQDRAVEFALSTYRK